MGGRSGPCASASEERQNQMQGVEGMALFPGIVRRWWFAARGSPFKPGQAPGEIYKNKSAIPRPVFLLLIVGGLGFLLVIYSLQLGAARRIAATAGYCALGFSPAVVVGAWIVRKRSWVAWVRSQAFQEMLSTSLGVPDVVASIMFCDIKAANWTVQTEVGVAFLGVVASTMNSRLFSVPVTEGLVIYFVGVSAFNVLVGLIPFPFLGAVEATFWRSFARTGKDTGAVIRAIAVAGALAVAKLAAWYGIFQTLASPFVVVTGFVGVEGLFLLLSLWVTAIQLKELEKSLASDTFPPEPRPPSL